MGKAKLAMPLRRLSSTPSYAHVPNLPSNPSSFTIDDEQQDSSDDESHDPSLGGSRGGGGGDRVANPNFARRFYDTLTFNFLLPLLKLGNSSSQINYADLPGLWKGDRTGEIEAKFVGVWAANLERVRERIGRHRKRVGKSRYGRHQVLPKRYQRLRTQLSTGTPNLRGVLIRSFGLPFASAGLLKLIHDLCAFVGPYVLKRMVIYFRSTTGTFMEGLLLTLAVTSSQLVMSLTLRQYFFHCYRTGLRLRTSVIMAVFKKSLNLSPSERGSKSSGEITNLMSVDAQRLQDLTPYLHAVWYSFLQIGLAIYFLWGELGPSCLGGVAVIVTMMPVTKKLGRYLGKMQKGLMKSKDERLKLNTEILSGVKVIKLQSWESSFHEKINSLRSSEVEHMKKYAWFQALSGTLWSTVPLLVSVATFATYSLSGNVLTVETALTSLALFELLRFPLFMLPNVINNLVEAGISIQRIEDFLRCSERCSISSDGMESSGIYVDSATFVWESGKRIPNMNGNKRAGRDQGGNGDGGLNQDDDNDNDNNNNDDDDDDDEELSEGEWEHFLLRQQIAESQRHIKEITRSLSASIKVVDRLSPLAPPTPPRDRQISDTQQASNVLSLRRVCLSVNPGDLVAIVGSVGSGKSTLVNGLLGECRALAGQVSVKGKVAYVAQKPFIMNDTLRNNVTFSNCFEEGRYQRAIEACALASDLRVLPGGDLCGIGEKGINLSGGQKARVSLARALYDKADIYLLDDPLSAVDAHVGKHLFDECILGELLDNSDRKSSGEAPCGVVLVTNALQFLNHSRVTKIVVLEGGVIQEEGSFEELMSRKGGGFYKLYNNYIESSSESMGAQQTSKADAGGVQGIADEAYAEVSDAGAVCNDGRSNRRESSSAAEADAQGTKLMTDEMKERETGDVRREVYLLWIKSMGGWSTVFFIVLSYIGVEGMNIAGRWWLTYWSEQSSSAHSSHSHNHPTQGQFLGVYSAINIAVALAMFVRMLYLYLSSLRAAKAIFMQLVNTILRAPMSFFDTTPLGRISNRFSKDTYTMDQQLASTIRMYLGTLASVIGTVIVICSVTPYFTITLIPIVIFYLRQQRYFTKTYRELKRLDSVSRSPIYALFSETLDGVATIRAYKAEESLKRRMVKLLDKNQTAFFNTFAAQCWLAVRLELAGTCIIMFACLAAVLDYVFRRDLSGSEAFAGAAGLSISFALSVTQSLNWSVRMSSDLEAHMVSVERVNQYIKNVKPEAPSETPNDGMVPAGFPKGEIRFEGVEMRYREGLPLVLKGLNLTIPAGSKVGVVGRTGAGKSSLMIALARIVELSRGAIYFDGVDCSKLGLHFLRSKLAIVSQDPVLFSGTVRANLDPFNAFPDSKLEDALKRVSLMKADATEGSGSWKQRRVKSLFDKVDEDGSNFSVGERQLIVIARALLSDCSIVLMDEATAAIDVETDAAIQRVLRSEFGAATVITVAHRLNTIMDSDLILVMSDGISVEFGEPAKLLDKEDGVFKGLVNAYELGHSTNTPPPPPERSINFDK